MDKKNIGSWFFFTTLFSELTRADLFLSKDFERYRKISKDTSAQENENVNKYGWRSSVLNLNSGKIQNCHSFIQRNFRLF